MRWTAGIVMGWAALALVAGTAAAGAPTGSLSVNFFKHADSTFEADIDLGLGSLAGVTGVGAHAADGSAVALTPYGSNQFAAWLGAFASFDQAHAAGVGLWTLDLHLSGGGVASYEFVVHDFRPTFDSASFPPAPMLTAPLGGATGVSPTPTFTWDNGGAHTGQLESLFVNVWSESIPGIGAIDGSGGTLSLNATTWTPPVVLPAGAAKFLVQYETNENEDANVDNPIFRVAESTVADPMGGWTSAGDLFSRDQISFTVAPEPATLSMLVLGGLALLARRRR